MTLSIVLPKPVNKALERASKETNLQKAELIRQSIRLGLPQFVAGFPRPQKTATATAAK
jgi:hypothetical protein